MAYKINEVTKKNIFDAVRNPHSVILAGNRGSGMHATALIMAKAYLGTNELAGHPDFIEIGTEDKEITKDMVAVLIDKANMVPLRSYYNVFVIDNAEKMNKYAQNSLLKTLESNRQSIFIMVAHSALLETIESRVKKIQFLPVMTGLDVKRSAFHASLGTPGAYFEIENDEPFRALLDMIPSILTSRIEMLRAMNCVRISDKSFYETEGPRKVEYIHNLIIEGLQQTQLAKRGFRKADKLFEPLGSLSEERIEYMLDLVKENLKAMKNSKIYGKNDFYEFLLKLTKEVA